jgi:AraC family transcriptional activator of pobA
MDALRGLLYNSNMVRHEARTQIENFNLFGEAGELPDVVHCETIETRSKIHNWEFRPHRHMRLHQVLLLDRGGGSAALDTHRRKLTAGSLINVPACCVHGFSFTTDTKGWVVTMASELLDESLRAEEGLRSILSRPSVAECHEGQRDLVRQIFHEHAARSFARAHALRALSALLLGHVARTLQNLEDSDTLPSDDPLRIRFEKLLEQNFWKRWSVADYAHRLSVSPTHLSRVLRQATGMPASRVIEARILREARRHLFFTNLGVSEIAYLLGYNDPAYFSRVFSKATGMSPKTFRSQADRSA